MSNLSVALATSLHLLPGDYNAIHPSIQWTAANNVIAGVYLNSEHTVSPFAGYRFEYKDLWLEAGVVAGYSASPVLPFARAGIDLEKDLRFFVAPGATTKREMGLVLGLELELWSGE